METKSNYTRLVQMYLMDELSTEEKQSFETALKTNSKLREELELQQNLNNAILDDELENFKIGLDEIHQNLTQPLRAERSINYGKISLIAATLIILFTIGALLKNRNSESLSPDEIFETYYKKYASLNVSRDSEIGMAGSQYQDALINYETNNYEIATIQFQSIITDDPKNIAARFYLGIIYIELGKESIAIDQFESVIKSHDQYYLEHAEWYKALCLIKLKQKRAAFNQFNSIIEYGGYYSCRAEAIVSSFD